jgi:hypothetical protein
MNTRNVFALLLLGSVAFLLLGAGCSPVQKITITAPAGTSYQCFLDGEPIGTVGENDLTITVEPGTHTLFWSGAKTSGDVDILLPITDDLLASCLNSSAGLTTIVYWAPTEWLGQWIDRYGMSIDAPYGSRHIGGMTYGDRHLLELSLVADCVSVISSVEYIVGMPETFRATVQVDILSDACVVGPSGEGES